PAGQVHAANALADTSRLIYTSDGTVAQTIQFLTSLTGITNSSTAASIATALASQLTTVDVTKDHVSFSVYDAAGRQVYSVNGLGETSRLIYNADGTVAQTIQFLTRLTGITNTSTAASIATALASQLTTVDLTKDHVT